MPLFDYECIICGELTERLNPSDIETIMCPKCGANATKIISGSGRLPDDAPWIKSVVDVVDKANPAPHVQEFVRHPTRANYKRWMRAEGLRHLEPGERPARNTDHDLARIRADVIKKHFERKKISIGGR